MEEVGIEEVGSEGCDGDVEEVGVEGGVRV